MRRIAQWTLESAHQRLRELHREWYKIIRNAEPFNYQYLRTADPGLVAFLDSKRYSGHLADAFARSGINPSCHIGRLDYGNSDQQRRTTWLRVMDELRTTIGDTVLNDNSMNSNESLVLPQSLRFPGEFVECERHHCEIRTVTLQSIYQQGARLFRSWPSAVEAMGIDYTGRVRRKVPARTRAEYIGKFDTFLKTHTSGWSISGLRKEAYPTYRGLFASHAKSAFAEHVNDRLLCAYVEAEFVSQSKIADPIAFLDARLKNLKAHFYENVLRQNVWVGSRARGGQQKLNLSRVTQELLKRYAEGRRLDRFSMERSVAREDRTLLAATRRNFKDHNMALNRAGLRVRQLTAIYKELDNPFPFANIYAEFQRLMRESLESGENRLTSVTWC